MAAVQRDSALTKIKIKSVVQSKVVHKEVTGTSTYPHSTHGYVQYDLCMHLSVSKLRVDRLDTYHSLSTHS